MNTASNETLSNNIISHYFGSLLPKVIFYLPTPPIIPTDWSESDPNAAKRLIEANGNHWRKIIIIICKLVSKELSCWRTIQNTLFQQNSIAHLPMAIAILDQSTEKTIDIKPDSSIIHIICGKNTFSGFTIESTLLVSTLSLNQQQTIRYHQQVFLTPYLDYRQFPNALIDLLRPKLHQDR
ncbi:DUF6942 family protein [Shewanella sp. HL-SH8]|uniref:DUF6942 family protein n=1 Tax=Shewanella sp. HL-SH8 TaxID=3436242 RepID=UPI003EBC5639